MRNGADWRQVYTGIGIGAALVAVVVWIAYGIYGSWRTVAPALPVVPLLFGLVWNVGQTRRTELRAWARGGRLARSTCCPRPTRPTSPPRSRDLAAQKGTGACGGRDRRRLARGRG